MSNIFEILHEDKNSRARVGILKTKTGEYKTPFFMPVATKGIVKYIDSEELEKMGANALISNAFLLYLKPGLQVIKKHNGLHKFMNWNKCIFTDSGGFQVLSFENLKGTFSNEGLKFKSPFDGSEHLLTPKKVMEIEQELQSDVAMSLDQMPLYGSSKNEIELATKRTHSWAQECLKFHKDRKQLLFGIAQGGTFADLRTESTKFISSLDFEGIALGGLCIGEQKEKTIEMIKISTEIIPKNKPRYLMGVGSVKEILEAVELGIDIFDSAWPTRNARHGRLMAKKGDINIENKEFEEELEPIDLNCNCDVCRRGYSKAYLRNLYKTQELTYCNLASFHNLYFILNLMREIRESINAGNFSELKERWLKK